jgi:uncharacterized membrane protein affecting hemolysin expression
MDVRLDRFRHALADPRLFAIAVAALASLLTSLLIGVAWAWQYATARDARIQDFGVATVRQLATLAVEPLLAADRIRLGALVTQLAAMPTVRLASVHTLDDQLVALAGDESLAGAHAFVESIAFEGEVAGYARITVEDAAIGESLVPGPAVWLMVALAVAGAALAAHFAYAALFEEDPVPDGDDAMPPDASARVELLTVVNFFNQNRIPAERRGAIVGDARARLERLVRSSTTRLVELPGTGWALCTTADGRDPDFAFAAFCTALAATELLDELNEGPDRLPGIELAFRCALLVSKTAFDTVDSLRTSDTLQDALVLSAAAPNGCVVASAEAFERLLRPERFVVEELANALLGELTSQRRGGGVVVSTIAESYRPAVDRLVAGAQPGTTSSPSTF